MLEMGFINKIILGDCFEIMPEIPRVVDAVITDPPFGISSNVVIKRKKEYKLFSLPKNIENILKEVFNGLEKKRARVNDIVKNMEDQVSNIKNFLKEKNVEINKLSRKIRFRKRLEEIRKGRLSILFTHFRIPLLYEYLFPFYKTPPHEFDPHRDKNRKYAYYPQELIRDITDLLRILYPEEKTMLKESSIRKAISTYLDSDRYREVIKNILIFRFPRYPSKKYKF